MLSELAAGGAFAGDPLTLIDVGCSLGIEAQWRAFPLRARGIDPMLHEIERLRRLERDPCIEYTDGFVRLPGHPPATERELGSDNSVFDRSSALEVAQRGSLEVRYNRWFATKLSEKVVTLDDLAEGLGGVDFVKSDTDGNDLEVLLSGETMLRTVLGISVETVNQSSTHPLSNSRSNVDQFMRRHGFSLFDEQTYRYSRRALPSRFLYGIPAQTVAGQVNWSQCLYLRDLVAAPSEWPPGAIRKLAGIHELHGLNDCAAELLLKYPAAFEPFIDPTKALDLLTRGWWPEANSYAELMDAFANDLESFYPT
jgi:hypothetical protein